jgi:hypothetical protein
MAFTRRYVPTSVAAAALGITPSGVRTLASRGILRRYGTKGRAMYDLDECERLMLNAEMGRKNLPINSPESLTHRKSV